jgi:hypothetical protein
MRIERRVSFANPNAFSIFQFRFFFGNYGWKNAKSIQAETCIINGDIVTSRTPVIYPTIGIFYRRPDFLNF